MASGVWAAAVGTVIGALALPSGCGSTDCSFTATCTGGATVDGAGGDALDGGSDAPTDPCLENPTAAECLDESKALFVSGPKGKDDGATGTRDKPFQTITAALKSITAAKRRIYICEARYPEDIVLGATHAGLSLFGGLNCDWAGVPDAKPVIGASANPFRVDGTSGLAIADIAVEAKDATAGSSIAVLVTDGEVTIKRARFKAGSGAKGGDGTLTEFPLPLAADLAGVDAASGGGAKVIVCPGGLGTTGGSGGKAGAVGAPGLVGTPNGGIIAMCAGQGTGGDGKAGSTPSPAAGALKTGKLGPSGWEPGGGASGEKGPAGQGGGGGSGIGGDGGGGGAGGCGGNGGGGGKGGGGSIALAVHQAKLSLSLSRLEARTGGPGGKGVAGQAALPDFGARGSGGAACSGGNGGKGGDGAAGGGGAGGISVGVLYKGAKPALDRTTVTTGDFGLKGAGGAATVNDGVDGQKADTLEAPAQ